MSMSAYSKIIGVGSYVPPKVFTNHDLEKMMDTSDEWIVQRTGIQQRHWVEGQSTSDLALEASKIAIEDAGLKTEDIDMIIFATLSPDHDFPGSGVFLGDKLGLNGIPALDIRQQCSGFLYGLSTANNFIKSGQYKNILLVGAEVHSTGLDKTPNGRAVSVLFGDGAGAVVVSGADDNSGAHIVTANLHADGKFAKELWLPAPGTGCGPERMTQAYLDEGLIYPHMNGKTVFVHAVKRMGETLMLSAKQAGLGIEDIDLFLFHQANLRICDKIAEVMNIPQDKIFNTIQKYGNTTAATIPLGMHDAIKEGRLKPGMTVASAAFGSGFTWASAIWKM